MLKKIIVLVCLLLTLSGTVLAVKNDASFSYKGIKLGDDYQSMTDKIGKPRFDLSKLIAGTMVTYYMYKDDTKIGFDTIHNQVVDIQIGDKNYVDVNGIKIGATPYKMQNVYGKSTRTMLGGKLFYIYVNEKDKQEKLLLQLDPDEGYLTGFRITNLIVDENSDIKTSDADLNQPVNPNDVNTIYMGSKDIDTSRVKTNQS